MTTKRINAGDETQVASGKAKEKKEREQELSDVRSLLKTEFGKRFLWRLFEEGDLYSHGFTGNSTTYFLCGKRAAALEVLNDVMEANPVAYANMMLADQQRKVKDNG